MAPELHRNAGVAKVKAWLRSPPPATLIYGGGLRVSECCELRVKDIDCDQDLIHVRAGKGDKDRSTLLPVTGREQLRTQLGAAEAQYRAGRQAGLAGVWMPDALDRHANVETTMIYTHVVKELRNPARSPADLLQDRAGK